MFEWLEYEFMLRALAATSVLSFSIALVGAFLVALNLLGAFKALGTLMAVGLMILPATAARYWVSTLTGYLVLTFLFALASCWAGLILSFYASEVPSGPAIILVAGAIFFVSVLFASQGLGFLRRRRSLSR